MGGLLSATVVIPAVYLVGGKRLTAYMISFMLPTVMKGIDARFRNVRKELLRGVEGMRVLFFNIFQCGAIGQCCWRQTYVCVRAAPHVQKFTFPMPAAC